jgi:hypothetical protein
MSHFPDQCFTFFFFDENVGQVPHLFLGLKIKHPESDVPAIPATIKNGIILLNSFILPR